jgi:ATP phosphoribosyltransferase
VVGLADAVIDIVATGTTLRVHRLEEVEAIMESTARFVVPRPRHGGSAESAEEMLRRLGADVEV